MVPELAELARLPLEQALNAALAADPASQASLSSLHGKRIRMDLLGLFTIDLLPQGERLVVAEAGPDVPDATLRATPLGLLRARIRGDLMHGDIELIGDGHVAVHAARLLGGLRPDIECALEPYVGIIMARQLGRLWHGMGKELHRLLKNRLQDHADFLRDETGLLPHRAELKSWLDAVDELRDGVDALEARISRLAGGQR